MKRFFSLLTSLLLAGTLAACAETGGQSAASDPASPASEPQTFSSPEISSEFPAEPASEEETRVLVAYFSATGNTGRIAGILQSALDADLFAIQPQEPYTEDDLNYSNDDCRANQEQNDPDARPAITGTPDDPDSYDLVFLGYPIWWGGAPKVVYTFLESCDFGDAVIVPFCTSGSSGIGSSAEDLHALAGEAQWQEGRRFAGSASEDEVLNWLETLELPAE